MNKIFVRETDGLKENILRLANEIESRMEIVLKAIEGGDTKKLLQIMASDRDIDDREVEIEEECLKILALHQPVARDLRFVVAVMKINNDLERVGDILVNIANRGYRLEEYRSSGMVEDIIEMGRLASEMLRASLVSLISLDVSKAIDVIKRDDELDAMNVELIKKIMRRAEEPEAEITPLLLLHSLGRDIERIGDHATNIAEDVAYLADGWIIRKKKKNLKTGVLHGQREDTDS